MRSAQKVTLVLLLSAIASGGFGQAREDFQAHLSVTEDPVILGAPETGSTSGELPLLNYAKVLDGEYQDRTFEIDCLPFLVEETDRSACRYWAFPTDDTGYGWDEAHPIILTSEHPIPLEGDNDRIRVLAKFTTGQGSWVPEFQIVAGYSHSVRD
jgi:hypothetical protein